MRPAIQLFTLRELDETLPDLLGVVGETAFEGVEFAGLGDTDPEEVRAALDDADLEATAAHVGIDDLEADLDGDDDLEADQTSSGDVIESYRRLGCDRIVVPFLDVSHFQSERAVTDTARRFGKLSARLADHDIDLGYHNHDHEFTALDGESAFELFGEETDIDLELDVGWATAAGSDPIGLLGHFRGRVPLVHLKDVSRDTPVELGEGDLDVEACVRAAREAGTEWLVYEHDDPADPEASLRRGAESLAELLG